MTTATTVATTESESVAEAVECDSYNKAGWHYELLLLPTGELRVVVTGADTINVDGAKRRMSFRRVFAPTPEKAKDVFAQPFGHLAFELTDEASYEPLPDK